MLSCHAAYYAIKVMSACDNASTYPRFKNFLITCSCKYGYKVLREKKESYSKSKLGTIKEYDNYNIFIKNL